jgi:hypothetical protein
VTAKGRRSDHGGRDPRRPLSAGLAAILWPGGRHFARPSSREGRWGGGAEPFVLRLGVRAAPRRVNPETQPAGARSFHIRSSPKSVWKHPLWGERFVEADA